MIAKYVHVLYVVCKRRYKTVASLKAHTTQYHGRDMSASSSPVPQPIISTVTQQPPSLPLPTSGPATGSGLGTVGAAIPIVTIPAPVPPVPDEKVPVFLRPPPNLQVRTTATNW